MRLSEIRKKHVISIVLCLVMLVSTVAFVFTVNAQEVETLTDTGADTYYLWGENSNSPNFNASKPTGTFTYDSAKGYYYYDLTGASGDYCFVVSTISNSASYAVKTPAVQTVQNAGSYYLSAGNYHGFNCIHLWNPSGDAVRIYFTSTSAGLNAVKAGADPTVAPTVAPTTAPTTPAVDPTTTAPTETSAAPDPTTGSDTGKRYVYCKNEAGWSSVYAYLWNSTSDNNHEWPGVKMTNIGGDVWRYEVPKNFAKIIFNIGSNQTQTGDMTYPGDGYIYNNKDKSWEIYDTSPLQISSFTTDLASPQYNGVAITLSAQAEGQGTVYYKFSAVKGSSTVVLSDYSTANTAKWTPTTPGTYTLKYEFRDAAGNTNSRTKQYVVEDGTSSAAPYIKTVSPSGGDVQKNSSVNINVVAGGGITGTNLLFYKYTVKNASGDIVNVPYYTRNTNYSFTPTAIGEYTVTVSVQASDNKTVERSFTYNSVNTVVPTEAPATEPPATEAPATEAPAPTEPPVPTAPPTEAPDPTTAGSTIIYGDCDDDEDVTSIDVTYIQRYNVDIPLPTPINLVNADVDADEDVTIIDATLIQRFLVDIIKKFPAEQ